MALRAVGNAPNITAFHFRGSVVLVSGQCGVPQWPVSTRLSRSFGQQRGHVSPPVAALGGNGTSPLDPVRCSVVLASGRGGVPPCPSSTRLSRGVRGFCSVRPLRPPASLLHNAAFCEVVASRCAKAPLGAGHRFAPSGFTKQALCKVAFAGDERTAVGASRSLARPTRRHLRALVGVCLHLCIGQALRAVLSVSGLRPVILCVPPPTRWPRRCAALALRWVCPSAPKGLPQPSAWGHAA